MMGVNYDLFWTLTPKSLTPFIKAFELKRDSIDAESWQLGAYIQMAIASVMSSDVDYPKEPYSARKISKVAPMSKTEQLKEIMMERMAIVNSQMKREGETKDESK